jgi:hypothetical protein
MTFMMMMMTMTMMVVMVMMVQSSTMAHGAVVHFANAHSVPLNNTADKDVLMPLDGLGMPCGPVYVQHSTHLEPFSDMQSPAHICLQLVRSFCIEAFICSRCIPCAFDVTRR